MLLDNNDLLVAIKKSAVEAVGAMNPTALVFGKVTSSSPLKINVEQKMTLTATQLVLTRNVTDYKTKISFDNPEIKQVFTTWNMNESVESSPSKITFKNKIKHDITIYNGLAVGDGVVLMRMQGGQKYLVLDRVVTI